MSEALFPASSDTGKRHIRNAKTFSEVSLEKREDSLVFFFESKFMAPTIAGRSKNYTEDFIFFVSRDIFRDTVFL